MNIILHLGSNLGNKKEQLTKAITEIDRLIGSVTKKSSFYKTAAWGNKNQEDFLNVAIEIKSNYSPSLLWFYTQWIELKLGKQKTGHWKARAIDIDIIFYNNLIINEFWLTIPHKHLHKRRFVLEPLNEIIPDFIHPVFNKSVCELLKECNDKLLVENIE